MANKGIHRHTPNSRTGRSMINIGKEPAGNLTKEQLEWNARVDAVKREKEERKWATKLPKQIDPNAWAFENGLESS